MALIGSPIMSMGPRPISNSLPIQQEALPQPPAYSALAGQQHASNFAPSQPSLMHFLLAAAGAHPAQEITPQTNTRMRSRMVHGFPKEGNALMPHGFNRENSALPAQAAAYPQFSPDLLRAAGY